MAEQQRKLTAGRADAPNRSPGRAKGHAETATTSKKLTFKEKKELDGLIERGEAVDAEVASIESKLADPATYQGEAVDVAALTHALEEAQRRSSELLERWEELEARREATSG